MIAAPFANDFCHRRQKGLNDIENTDQQGQSPVSETSAKEPSAIGFLSCVTATCPLWLTAEGGKHSFGPPSRPGISLFSVFCHKHPLPFAVFLVMAPFVLLYFNLLSACGLSTWPHKSLAIITVNGLCPANFTDKHLSPGHRAGAGKSELQSQ